MILGVNRIFIFYLSNYFLWIEYLFCIVASFYMFIMQIQNNY